MASIFSKIQSEAEAAGLQPYTEKSKKWFLNRFKKVRNIPSQRVLSDEILTPRTKPIIGRMFMFRYNPKGADTLPYYDRFPLILMVGPAKKGFYGLNLHYLHPRQRALFFDRLQEYLNNEKMDISTRFRLTYSLLSNSARMRAFAPCFKHYLFDYMASNAVEIPPTEWEIALFLPTDVFVGKDRRSIWNISKTLI